MKPEDYIKRLRENKLYRQALKQADSDAQRRAIIAQSENFVVGFTSKLGPLLERLKNERNGLVSSEPVMSGSLERDE